ncbi:MAG TPA: class I SAM-dependent methyltransferase, partial [Isosphaeraceae bacterium]|nr:class I SAM-dependent methyltransferase [Isosphaeraceae bacterium]
KPYVGCDMRPGLGVDRVEDVTALTLPDASVGTILCIETFEHVFEVRRAFDEVFRVLRPGGIFILTSPFNFRLHGYPDDYWRISPSCLRRMLEPYAARISGAQGHDKFPHTVMSLAIKSPAPSDFTPRAERFVRLYQDRLHQLEASLPLGDRLRRKLSLAYRSRGERHQIADYYTAHFSVDTAEPKSLSVAV